MGACFLSPHPVRPIKPMSLGGPALGMAVDVYDDDGKPVRGEVGELVCTAPWPGMTRGLYKDPERYLDTYWSRWPDVWLHGDWASIDEDGDWFLHGRSNDTIKVKDHQGNDVSEQVSFDADNHLATLTVGLRPGTYQLVVTTGITDINGVAVAQEYDAPLVISR